MAIGCGALKEDGPDRIQREVMMNGDMLWLVTFVRLTVRCADEF